LLDRRNHAKQFDPASPNLEPVKALQMQLHLCSRISGPTQIGYAFFMLHYAMLSQLCLARDVLKENTEQKMSIKLLAQELGMSQYHFIRLFSSVFGLTPHRYRILNQLDRAKQELVQSKKAVTDIAFDCGFSSLGTFSLMFKNYAGVSPRLYRDTYSAGQVLNHNCFGLISGLSNSNF
jgi:AraC-like DNA-binding protein